MGKRELVALLFCLPVFLVSLDYCVALPHGATGLSAVFLIILTIFRKITNKKGSLAGM